MNNQQERKFFLIALLIALLINIVILLFLFLKPYTEHIIQFARDNIAHKAPVVFKHEEPAPQQPQPESVKQQPAVSQQKHIQPPQPDMPAALTRSFGSLDGNPDKKLDKQQPVPKKEIEKQPKEKIIEPQEEQQPEEPVEEADEIQETQEQAAPEPTPEEVSQPEPEMLDATDVTVLPKEDSKKTKTASGKKSKKVKTIKRTAHGPTMSKDVIEGFNSYMQQQGNNAFLERQGVNRQMTQEEQNILNYYNRVISCFKKSETEYDDLLIREVKRFMRKNPQAAKIEVTIRVIINADGSLDEIRKYYGSGVDVYDNYIIDTFKKAAPYPRIPIFIKQDKIIFPVTIYLPLMNF